MFTDKLQREFYQAMLEKNIEYEGVFYVRVLSTGIFFRPTCSARKPKFENCKFYRTAKEALLASFRPCMRCHPLSNPDTIPSVVSTLITAIEASPEKKWSNADLAEFSIDASTARRQFQKRFGMSFIEYARARRMEAAIKQIHAGDSLIETQLSAGYESSSGFRDAFSKIMGSSPMKKVYCNVLQSSWIDTPLGPMIGIADKEHLYLLEFSQRHGLQREIEQLCNQTKSVIIPGKLQPLISIKEELRLYFAGQLKKFKTPLYIQGTEFQKTAWEALINIPYGQTRSYKEQARIIGKPLACRAVANANASNQFAIIIPCHRIINSDGKLGGYAGGTPRKQWLLEHEQRHLS